MKLLRGKSYWLSFLFVLLCFCAASPTKATTIVIPSDSDLIVTSRAIVAGQVNSVTAAWDDYGSMAWTYVEIQIDDVLKGNAESTIVLKQMGGIVGDSGIEIPGQPRFVPGERVLLYLNTGIDGTLHTNHTFVGKFSVIRDSSGRQFVERSIDTRSVQFLAQADERVITNRAPLDSYVESIRETLRREAPRVAENESARSKEALLSIPPEYERKKREGRGYSPEFVLYGGGIRWMEADSGQSIPYNVNPSGCPVAGGGTAEITRAMNAWPNDSGANIHLRIQGQTSNCGIVMDSVNTISFNDCQGQLDPPIGCAGVVALTSFSWTREFKVIGGTTFSRLLEADTIFNKNMQCFLGVSANLAEVACHELGHSIGLDHSADTAAIMWAAARGHGRDATLGADDKAGAQAIYPSSGGGSGGSGGGGSGGALTISSLVVGDGLVGRSYDTTLTAIGGMAPYHWSLIGGTLPPGLNFSGSGNINGVPVQTGSFTFAVQVHDVAIPPQADARWITLTVRDAVGSGTPAVTRVKIKGSSKLRIFGINFRSDSQLLINGVTFVPTSFDPGGSEDSLLLKRRPQLSGEGSNVVVVVNGSVRSSPFFF